MGALQELAHADALFQLGRAQGSARPIHHTWRTTLDEAGALYKQVMAVEQSSMATAADSAARGVRAAMGLGRVEREIGLVYLHAYHPEQDAAAAASFEQAAMTLRRAEHLPKANSHRCHEEALLSANLAVAIWQRCKDTQRQARSERLMAAISLERDLHREYTTRGFVNGRPFNDAREDALTLDELDMAVDFASVHRDAGRHWLAVDHPQAALEQARAAYDILEAAMMSLEDLGDDVRDTPAYFCRADLIEDGTAWTFLLLSHAEASVGPAGTTEELGVRSMQASAAQATDAANIWLDVMPGLEKHSPQRAIQAQAAAFRAARFAVFMADRYQGACQAGRFPYRRDVVDEAREALESPGQARGRDEVLEAEQLAEAIALSRLGETSPAVSSPAAKQRSPPSRTPSPEAKRSKVDMPNETQVRG